jgi:hypothetical protein
VGALLCAARGAALGFTSARTRVWRVIVFAIAVICSWLMAVAVLAAVLHFLPVTPGYLPDHVE